jgi:2,3-bisphosphoglycerate-independent phosphoglycerate mutase
MDCKILYVLLDGVGDRPNPQLNGLTPLQAAYTPNLDNLARNGCQGLVYPVKGVAPESDLAVLAVLGYEFKENYFGRGVLEALGVGINFKDGDLALRANFATVDNELNIIDRRAGRNLSTSEARELAKTINEKVRLRRKDIEFVFIPTIAHRAVLHFKAKGARLSSSITNTDPAYVKVGDIGEAVSKVEKLRLQRCVPMNDSKEAKISAELVNEFTEKSLKVLKEHVINKKRIKEGKKPANSILLRDASSELPKIKTLPEKFNARFACLVAMPVEKGIGKVTGMRMFEIEDENDYEGIANKALSLLKNYDFVYVHLKGPDIFGHDGNAVAKKKSIEDIDKRFFGSLSLSSKVMIAVTADHSTPCTLKAHSADPVPLLVYGCKAPKDKTCRFNEVDAKMGILGQIEGKEVIKKLFEIC